jgi:hypothetical protein
MFSRARWPIFFVAMSFAIVANYTAANAAMSEGYCKRICERQTKRCLNGFDNVRKHPEKTFVIDTDLCGFTYKIFVACNYCPSVAR